MADDEPKKLVCKVCKDNTKWSDLAALVMLWYPNNEWPVPLRIPQETSARVCLGCDALLELFDRVQTKDPDPQPFPWQIARVVFRDGYSVMAANPKCQKVAAA